MSTARKYLLVTITVLAWMGLGWALKLDPNSYLLLGIPFLLVFQIFVARRPVVHLWLKNRSRFEMPWWGYLIAACFAAYPGFILIYSWHVFTWPVRLWFLCAIFGTLPLAFTLVNFERSAIRPFVLCLLTAGVAGMLLECAAAFAIHGHVHFSLSLAGEALGQFLLYLPICFVLEEVFFRGGLDSFLHDSGDPHPWLSAIFISCLWGIWHMPALSPGNLSQAIGLAILLPVSLLPMGIPFSLFWRRGGTLLITATVHALVDSIRNVLLQL